jgi:hypothetical protein
MAQIHRLGWWAPVEFRQVPLDSSLLKVTFLHITAWSPRGPDETWPEPTSRVGVSEPFTVRRNSDVTLVVSKRVVALTLQFLAHRPRHTHHHPVLPLPPAPRPFHPPPPPAPPAPSNARPSAHTRVSCYTTARGSCAAESRVVNLKKPVCAADVVPWSGTSSSAGTACANVWYLGF